MTDRRAMLRTNELLRNGEYLAADNDAFFAILQDDGNFCVYQGSDPGHNRGLLWATGKPAAGGTFAIMQEDGNFCVYKGTGPGDNKGGVWDTGKRADGKEFFAILQADGNFCVYKGSGPGDNKGIVWNVGSRFVEGVVYDATVAPVDSKISLFPGANFTQTMRSERNTFPTELRLAIGNGEPNAFNAEVVLRSGDRELFRHTFIGVVQPGGDGLVVFPIYRCAGAVLAGETVSFTVTPDREVGMITVSLADPNCPPSPAELYGNVVPQFALTGKSQADQSAYPPDPLDPTLIAGTVDEHSATTLPLPAGVTFTQQLVAFGRGKLGELGVRFGNGDAPFGCHVKLVKNNDVLVDHDFTLVQRPEDRAAVVQFAGFTGALVHPYDILEFSLTPHADVTFEPLYGLRQGLPMNSFPGSSNLRCWFFLRARS
jgi:hypothetical protein